MYGGNDKMVFKNKLLVELELDSGRVLIGYMFVGQQQRLSDLMNDDRHFLPFENLDSSIYIFHKTAARGVRPVEKKNTANVDADDPFQVLGVADDASDVEIREAYHRCVQENHPDRLQSMSLPAEFIRLAHERMTSINDAYAKIKRMRINGNGAAAQ
jgi:DnaJ-domain-containing protein 1